MTGDASKGYFSLLPAQQWAGWLLAGFGFFVTWDQYYWWTGRDDYSFGFLVPVFVGYVLFERWPIIRRELVEPADSSPGGGPGWLRIPLDFLAGLVFLLALACLGFGSLLRATQGPQVPASLSVAWGYCWMILSVVYLFSAQRRDGSSVAVKERLKLTSLFLFPSLIWLISAPLLSFLERGLSLFLLSKVAAVVFFLLDLFGTPVQQEGNVLLLGVLESGEPNRVMVEDACSGIRSLMACLFAGSFLSAVFLNRLWKKVLLVGLSMAFAFLMNIFRSLFLTLWALNYGADSIQGAVHDITGYAVLGLTCLGLIALLPIINFKYEFKGGPEEDHAAGAVSSG